MRMRLDSIDLYQVRIALARPVCLDGRPISHKDAIIVRLGCSRGVGWGEASMPFEVGGGVPDVEACWQSFCERLAPAALALTETEPSQIVADLADVDVPPCLPASLDMAAWHAESLARSVPVHSLLGGYPRPMPSALTVPPADNSDDWLDAIDAKLACGYRALKVAIRPGWDIEPVAAIRHRWPDYPVSADGEGRYTMDDLATLRNLDKYGLESMMRPLPTASADDYVHLRASLTAPLSIDAAGLSSEQLQHLARNRAVDFVTIDVQACGGLTLAARVYGTARLMNLPCHLSGATALGLGAAASLQFGLLDGFDIATDIGSSSHTFADDVLEPPIVVDAGGYLHLPDGPGFGYRPSREKVEKHALKHETFMA